MGFDGYGYTSNAAAADRAISVAPLAARFDGVNDDFNLGDVVRGGVASIFWDLADSGQRDDDPIYYRNPLIAALQQAVGSGATLTAFHAAYTNLDAASIFIDHGFPAADDGYEPNDKAEDAAQLPDLKGAYKEKGLIVAEPAPGAGDWFVIHVPSFDKPKPQGKYPLRVRVGFDPRYGDLDLVVKLADDTQGRRAVRDIRRGGNSAAVQLTLDSTQEYDVLIGVFGHGATDPTKGGDFHPRLLAGDRSRRAFRAVEAHRTRQRAGAEQLRSQRESRTGGRRRGCLPRPGDGRCRTRSTSRTIPTRRPRRPRR